MGQVGHIKENQGFQGSASGPVVSHLARSCPTFFGKVGHMKTLINQGVEGCKMKSVPLVPLFLGYKHYISVCVYLWPLKNGGICALARMNIKNEWDKWDKWDTVSIFNASRAQKVSHSLKKVGHFWKKWDTFKKTGAKHTGKDRRKTSMKTLIAIPCMDMMHTAFVQSLMRLNTKPLGEVSVRFHPGSLIYDARNLLSLDAIQGGYDWVLWFDSDMAFPHDTAEKLTDTAVKTGADVVSGVYYKRTIPSYPVLFQRIAPPEKIDGVFRKCVENFSSLPDAPVFPIAGCGFGCVLTSVALLKCLWDTYGPPFSPFPWCGEDIAFCYRAAQLDAVMLADNRIPVGHVGMYEYGLSDCKSEVVE